MTDWIFQMHFICNFEMTDEQALKANSFSVNLVNAFALYLWRDPFGLSKRWFQVIFGERIVQSLRIIKNRL